MLLHLVKRTQVTAFEFLVRFVIVDCQPLCPLPSHAEMVWCFMYDFACFYVVCRVWIALTIGNQLLQNIEPFVRAYFPFLAASFTNFILQHNALSYFRLRSSSNINSVVLLEKMNVNDIGLRKTLFHNNECMLRQHHHSDKRKKTHLPPRGVAASENANPKQYLSQVSQPKFSGSSSYAPFRAASVELGFRV